MTDLSGERTQASMSQPVDPVPQTGALPDPASGLTPAGVPGKVPVRALLPLLLGALIGGMNGTILFIVLPPIARDLGFPDWSVGLLYSAAALMAAITAPFWGRRADRWGRKPVLLVGLFGYSLDMAILTLVLALALNGVIAGVAVYLALLLIRLLSGTFASATQPAAQAYIVDVTDETNRTSGLALLTAMSGMATILGPAIGALFGWLSVLAPAAVPAVLGLGNGLFATATLKEPVDRRERPPTPALSPFDPRIRVFLGVLLLGILAQSSLPGTMSFLVQDRLGLTGEQTTQQTGLILLAVGITALIVQLVVVRRLKPRPATMVAVGLPLFALCGLLFAAAPSLPFFLLAGVVGGAGFGFFLPGITAAATLAIPESQQGALGGLTFSVLTLSFAIGPLTAAALYGIDPLIPYGAVIAFAIGALALFLFRAPRPATPAGAPPAPGPGTGR